MVQGKSFVDALKGAVSTTLTPENIAKTFMTSAIMSAVMVGSGLVKACFVEDTMVSTSDGLKPIQDIAVGDSVYSFDEATGVVSCVAVTEIMRNTSKDVCTVALDTGESITSTSLHPWYVQGKGWTPAYALASGDILLTDEDEFVTISAVRRRSLSDPVDVYNMTVGDAEDDQYHTYFVGEDSVLVHNACSSNYKKNFEKNVGKKMPNDYEVHHGVPQRYKKIMKEAGVNVHDSQYLRGLPKDVHKGVTKMWGRWHRSMEKMGTITPSDVMAKKEAIDNFLRTLGDLVIWPK